MEERVSETEDLGLRRGAFFQCVRENGDRDLERAGGERRRSGETGTFRQPPKVLRFRIFLLHGTERFPQDPSGCPENESPRPDSETAGTAIFPSSESKTMVVIRRSRIGSDDFTGTFYVCVECDVRGQHPLHR